MSNTDDIKKTNKNILKGITKGRDTKMKSSGKSTGKTPSAKAATQGSARWTKQQINAAKGIMYGLRAGDQIIDLTVPEGSALAKANKVYTGSVDLLETLILIAEVVSNDIAFREQEMQQASQQVGKSDDIKGSMDQNTFMLVETNRTLNQLASLQNYSLSSANAQMRNDLIRRQDTTKMLTYKAVNPFY
ncbi:hypothetical protein C5748_08040 [Phyllobacterium phragmitis]|uniref:Uncharacterized protein n=2 Tax=Phyllobacterium phragmitis TaxID=2670329 RepID=A0A2S9ITH8_9HYPH|nr:hypothetical protein C5748_08040 [Phyllobacterium phragmitis]